MTNEKKLQEQQDENVRRKLKTRAEKMIPPSQLSGVDELLGNAEENREPMIFEIRKHGLMRPLAVVGPYEDGRYRIVDGNAGFLALKEILDGEDDAIPCYVLDGAIDDAQVRWLSMAANSVAKGNRTEFAFRYLDYLYKNRVAGGEMDEDEVVSKTAEVTGLCARQIRNYRNIYLRGSDGIVRAVMDGELPVQQARDIIRASEDVSEWSEERQAELMRAYQALPKKQRKCAQEDLRNNKGEKLCPVTKKSGRPPKPENSRVVVDYRLRTECDGLVDALRTVLSETARFSREDADRMTGLCRQVIDKLS